LTSYNHIWFISSGSSIAKKFYVVIGGYDSSIRKNGNIEDTLNGGIDYSVGSIREMQNLTLRVKHTSDEANFGCLQDIKDLFRLNNPYGSPSNIIEYVDHFGVHHNVYLVGELKQNLLTTLIEGTSAVYLVPITLYFIPEDS